MYSVFESEKGSLMLLCLMLFFTISLIGTNLMAIATLNYYISANDEAAEKARQTADAGIYIGRNIMLNDGMNGENAYHLKDIEVGREAVVSIEMQYVNNDENVPFDGELILITSAGTVFRPDGTIAAKSAAKAWLLPQTSDEAGRIIAYHYAK